MSRRGARPCFRRVGTLVVACLVSSGFVALPARAALAEDDPSTTTTTAPPDTTTTTAAPDTTTTTAAPDTTTTTAAPDTTTTTAAPDTTTTTPPPPPDPGPAVTDFSPDETLPPQPAFVNLSSGQRSLLQRLQSASDALAAHHFALLALAPQLAAAKEQLRAARADENAAAEREVFGLLAAPVHHNDSTPQALGALDTSSASTDTPLVRAAARAQSEGSVRHAWVAELDALTRRLESERKSARAERVKAQASVADLNARVTAETAAVADATAARDAAESDAVDAFGASAVHAQPDDITAALVSAQAGQIDPFVVTGFALPIPGAPLGSPYGIRIDPLGGGAGFHPGLDFEAGYGTEIHAAAAGVVIRAGDCGGYGYCVVIDHGSSLATLYGHQSDLRVHVGDHVSSGDVIGFVGSTGASTGPHLHFEVRLHGLPIDPVPTLTG